MNRLAAMVLRISLLITAAIGIPGCSDSGPEQRNECAPLAMKCEENVVFRCAPDIDLIRRGEHVYVWHETLVCEDSESLGKATCVESMLETGRVDAECEYESTED